MDNTFTDYRSNPLLREFALGAPSSAELLDQSSFNESEDSVQKTLNIKDLENAMDNLRKENFSLKLRIFYLQERLAKMGPESLENILNENIEFNVKIKELQNEISEKTRLLMQAHAAIEALQAQNDLNDKNNEKCDACYADLDKCRALATKWEKKATELQQQLQASQKLLQDKELREHVLSQTNTELTQKITQQGVSATELQDMRVRMDELERLRAMEEANSQKKILALEERISAGKNTIVELERSLAKAQQDLSLSHEDKGRAINLSHKISELESELRAVAAERTHAGALSQQLAHAREELERQHTQLDLEQQLRQRASDLEYQLRQKSADLEHQLRQKTAELDVARKGRELDSSHERAAAALESQLRRKTAELEQKTRAHDQDLRELDLLLQRKSRELEERELQYERASKEMEARLFERENLASSLQQRIEQCEQTLAQREEYTADELALLRETVVRLRAELMLDTEHGELQESRLQLEVKTADCAILGAQLDERDRQLAQKNHTVREALEA